MIEYIVGILIQKKPTEIVVEVGGIAYKINISLETFKALPATNETIKIYTSLIVRPEKISIFGFITQKEKEIFLKLININGIGPKLAQTILSGISPDELIESILEENNKRMAKIPGIGKKTAAKIIFELKDKIASPEDNTKISGTYKIEKDLNIVNEAILALESLGIDKKKAKEKVEQVLAKQTKINTIEELIKLALSR